jgi:hypothetical protein
MKTPLIALALLGAGLVAPASAKQSQHHQRNVMNARAQAPAAKPVADRMPASRVDADGRPHDLDMDWEIRNEEMHGWW